MRTFYYLVCVEFDETTTPLKITTAKQEAISYGQRVATRQKRENPNVSVALYEQEASHGGRLKRIRTITCSEYNINPCVSRHVEMMQPERAFD